MAREAVGKVWIFAVFQSEAVLFIVILIQFMRRSYAEKTALAQYSASYSVRPKDAPLNRSDKALFSEAQWSFTSNAYEVPKWA